ncbi:MAG: two-component system, cell cycle response regulator [Solirubrobacteraceae bacterium]|jgi:diguanylate cyclase (GGDEF)-like protein|nr:two-component system, cell cycle response regulator [Solirubrobacteraceae bacterium]
MNRRILIVEDDSAIRMLIRSVLESQGHEVHEAVDGLEALPKAREVSPHLVMLDIGLPGLDGFGVLGQLKDDPDLREVPVMMVTAWAEPELVAKALDRGAHDYVRKPFDIGELRARVDAALRSSDASDPATGLPGRHRLTEELERRVAATQRSDSVFSVVLVTLDGEEPADAVLHAVARRLALRVRAADLLCRSVHGSFVVVCEDTDRGGADALAEDLRTTLSERPLDTPIGGIWVSASVGVAQFAAGDHPEQLLQRAAADAPAIAQAA